MSEWIVADTNYLQHHGIQGQKWGVKNGPPYPLDKEVHNAVVKKAVEISSSLAVPDHVKQAIKLVPKVVSRLRDIKDGIDFVKSFRKEKVSSLSNDTISDVKKIPDKDIHGNYSKDDTVFVSGKVKFDDPLPKTARKEIDLVIGANAKVLIGDAPGADARVQDYLNKKQYRNVIVYTTDSTVRNNVGKWKVVTISDNGEVDERLIRRQKDIAMTNASTKGIAISSDDDRPDSATALNIQRLLDSGKTVEFFDYKKKRIYPLDAIQR